MKRCGEALKIAVNCMGDVNLKVEYWENFANTQTGISKTFVSMRMPRERRQHTYLLIYFILVIFFVYKWLDFLYNFVSNKSSIYLLSKTKKNNTFANHDTRYSMWKPRLQCRLRNRSMQHKVYVRHSRRHALSKGTLWVGHELSFSSVFSNSFSNA